MTWAILGFAALAIATIAGFAIKALTATRDAGKQEARGDALAVRVEAMTANNNELAAKLKEQKERADALDAAIVRAVAAGPIDGSFEQLLQARQAAHGADRRGDAAVPAASDSEAAAAGVGPDDLLPPGA